MTHGLPQDKPENYQPITINLKRFEDYAATFGAERARGYYDALKEIMNNIEGLYYNHQDGEYFLNPTPNRVRTRLTDFKNEKKHLLNSIEKSALLNENPKPEI